jgi:beta-glucosidase
MADSLEVKVTVSNQGQQAGSEVVQLYISDLQASFRVPKQSLRGIRRIDLKPGEAREVSFRITPEMISQVNMEGKPVIEPGRFRLTIGGCSPGSRGEALGMPSPAIVEFEVK